jgi:putative phosphoesterase
MSHVHRIGLISDTHGLLRSTARDALAGSDRIIHAGDIGDPTILDVLARIAPVTAVRGNNDRDAWAQHVPETATMEVGAWSILVIHDLNMLAIDPAAAGHHAVVAGHSHHPSHVRRGGVHYVNPGSAGPRRFRLPISVGCIEIGGDGLAVRLIELPA